MPLRILRMSTTRIKRYAVALLVVQIVILGLLENPLQAQQEATPGDGAITLEHLVPGFPATDSKVSGTPSVTT